LREIEAVATQGFDRILLAICDFYLQNEDENFSHRGHRVQREKEGENPSLSFGLFISVFSVFSVAKSFRDKIIVTYE